MSSDPALTPELVQAQAFSTSFRGYEQSEVRRFLARVAGALHEALERAEHWEAAWRSAEERAAKPFPMDEEELVAAVGRETAEVLRAARAAAAELRAKAEGDAARMIADAQARADGLRMESEQVMGQALKAAEEAARRLTERAEREAAELVARAREEAAAVKAAAENEKHLMIEGASTTRKQILQDLSHRRRVALVQIEQLRAGRERLLEAYGVVRRTLELAHEELSKADAEARAAAEEVGRRARAADPQEQVIGLAPEQHRAGEVDALTEAAAAPAVAEAPESREAAEVPEVAEAPEVVEAHEVAEAHTHPSGAPLAATAVKASGALDALFARIRLGQQALENYPTGALGKPETKLAAGAAGEPTEADTDAEHAQPEAGQRRSTSGPQAPDDQELVKKRNAAIGDLDSSLARKLKRLLQDEHNDLLDRLRTVKGDTAVAMLMPDSAEQENRYIDLSRPVVEQAAAAGAQFAIEVSNGGIEGAVPASPDVEDLIRESTSTALADLRRRVEHVLVGAAGVERQVVAEGVGAVYRDWKNQKVERLAADLVIAAFSRGTWHRVPSGSLLRWVSDDPGGACPDCDDDALAGPLPKGEDFPTGQPHPPAHSGCRCLLVPEPARIPEFPVS